MKCERCGCDLSGTSIMCSKCKHNNARQVVNNWRSKQTGLPAQATTESRTAESAATPRIKPRGDADENLIRFPAASPGANDDYSGAALDWRAQVKEKVRQARQKRQMDEAQQAPERPPGKDLEQNPIVQAALNRIKWTPTTGKPSYSAGRGAAALAEALDPFPELDTFSDPLPAPRPATVPPARKPANPFSQTTDRVEKIAPKIEPTPRQNARRPGVGFKRPEPVAQPATRSTPKPEPDLVSYADVAALASPKAAPPSVIPPLVPPPVITPLVAPPPVIEEKVEIKEVEPLAPERSVEPTIPTIKSEANGTQVIEIPSIISHMYEIVPAPATLWVRTLAGGCDLEILAMAFLPIFAAYAMLNTSLGSEALFILGVLLSALVFVYQAVCLQIAERTFGMALLNLKMINTSDENMPITRQQKLLRAWGATLAFLCPPLNLIIIRANGRGLSLPDLISGTSPIEGS